MPSWLGWIFQESVHIKRVWKMALALVFLASAATWSVKDYLDSTQKSNLRSEAAVLRTQLESQSAALDRKRRQLVERDAQVSSLESQLAVARNQEVALRRDLGVRTSDVEELKAQLRVQSDDLATIPTELSRAWAQLGLNQEEFRDLPLHWRQALAELALAPRADFPALARFVRELRADDILLIDRVARAIAHNGSTHFLVRSRTSPHHHPYLRLEFADFQRLREIGLLHSDFSRTGARINPSAAAPVSLWGSSVALAFYSSDGEAQIEFSVETFTAVGAALVELLRVPSDLRYFTWVAGTVIDSTLDVQLWAYSPSPDSPKVILPGMGRIEMVRLR